jgi:restriction system protein
MEQLPKYHETFIPILNILSDGSIIHINELRKRVFERFYVDIPEELLQLKTKNGDPLILNRIGWGKAYLKQGGYIHQPERAMVQITGKGRRALEQGSLTLEDLTNDPDFIRHRKTTKAKKEIESGVSPSASPQDLIDAGAQEIEESVKSELLDKLKHTDPYYFERVVLQLFHKMGYGEFFETAKSGDGGIDGIINQDQLGLEKIYVQAKRYSENKVREKDIRNFIGAMSGDTTKGIFVTTSEFDEGAIKKAREAHHKITLIDGEIFVEYMYKFGVGVQIKSVYEIKEIDEDFFESD